MTNHIQALEALLEAAKHRTICKDMNNQTFIYQHRLRIAEAKVLSTTFSIEPALREAIEVLKLRESGQLVRVPPVREEQ